MASQRPVYRSTGRGGAGNFQVRTIGTPNNDINFSLTRMRTLIGRGVGGAGNFVKSADIQAQMQSSPAASERSASVCSSVSVRSYSSGIGGVGNYVLNSGGIRGGQESNDSTRRLL
jgi:hypothetical protein